jgi:hypothetical protein
VVGSDSSEQSGFGEPLWWVANEIVIAERLIRVVNAERAETHLTSVTLYM